MLDSPIPTDVREFILRNIDSIAEVEALLLLRGEPAICWNAATVATRLYITEAVASKSLEKLHALGVAVRGDDGASRYECASDDLKASVDRLVDSYRRYLIPVTNLIHTKSASRVRQFADAFNFTKKR
jgi:hypothetical protein